MQKLTTTQIEQIKSYADQYPASALKDGVYLFDKKKTVQVFTLDLISEDMSDEEVINAIYNSNFSDVAQEAGPNA